MGISLVILGIFQNCGRWEAHDLYAETPKKFGFSQVWSEAILYKGLPYMSHETVYASDTSACKPIINPKSGQISYVGFFGDGSWHVVNLPDGTPRSRQIILSSQTVPGYSIQGLEFLTEKSIFVVFLFDSRPRSPQQNHKLLAISADGSQSWVIAENVLKAEISEDGSRVNYTAIDSQNPYGAKVFTSSIVAPSPQSLGTIDWQSTGSPYMSKSSSLASNIPLFYLQNRFEDENSNTRIHYAKRFGQSSGNSLPESFRVYSDSSYKDFEDFRLSKHGKMLTSRYSRGNFIDAKGIEHPRGETLMSPDGTLVAYKNSAGETAVYNEDGSSTLVPDSAGRIGPWSKDSRYVFIGTTTKWIIFDTHTNSRVNGTQPSSTSVDEIVALIGQNRFLLWKTNNQMKLKITALDGSNEITLNQGRNLNYPYLLFADTNKGIIFSDDWGLYFTNYDGSGRTRLDHPRANETIQVPKDSSVTNPFGLLVWDAPRSRLIFQPSLYLFNSSYTTPLRSLSILSADKSITRLTTDSKQVNQIRNYQVYEDLNLINFNSSDLSYTMDHIGPGPIPLIGSLDGGPSMSLSPKNFNNPNSFTLNQYARRPFTLAKVDNTIKYLHSFEPSSAFESLSSWGISPLALKGEFNSLSPDKKWALSFTYNPLKAYLTRTNSLGKGESIPIAGHLELESGTVCFGCGGSNAWSLQGSRSVNFVDDSKILLKAKSTNSFYLADTNHLDKEPVDLGIFNYAVLGNSASILGVDSQNNLVSIDLNTPNQKNNLGKKQFIGVLGHSVLLASNIAGSSFLYNSLNLLDLETTTNINLIPSALPPGSIASSSLIISNDQKTIFYQFQRENKWGLENTYYVIVGLDGSPDMIFKHSDKGWADFSLGDNANIKASADLQNLYFTQNGQIMHLNKNNNWVPKAITPESYQITSFLIGLKKLIIVAETKQNEKLIIVSNMDGTGSRILVEPMPAYKWAFDFRFIKNETSILFLTDAAEDRFIALTRIDLE